MEEAQLYRTETARRLHYLQNTREKSP